jgi:glucan phosphoethanolaminetransferase (alkaline phosphatase superfamily)
MDCLNHPGTEATDICLYCQQPVCSQCSVILSGKNYCKACLEKKVDPPAINYGHKNKFLAFLLSLVPGAGYYYLGLMRKGLQAMVVFFGAIFISGMANLDFLAAFVVPVMIFYSVFDTQQLLNRMIAGEPVEDRELFDWGSWKGKQSLVGGALIVIGLFALLNSLAPYFIDFHRISRIVPPLLIIGIGVYILYKNTKKGGDRLGDTGSPQ